MKCTIVEVLGSLQRDLMNFEIVDKTVLLDFFLAPTERKLMTEVEVRAVGTPKDSCDASV